MRRDVDRRRLERLVSAVAGDAVEQAKADRRAAAHELLCMVGGVEGARLTGLSRTRLYVLAGEVEP